MLISDNTMCTVCGETGRILHSNSVLVSDFVWGTLIAETSKPDNELGQHRPSNPRSHDKERLLCQLCVVNQIVPSLVAGSGPHRS